jgi:hypothetical protein
MMKKAAELLIEDLCEEFFDSKLTPNRSAEPLYVC